MKELALPGSRDGGSEILYLPRPAQTFRNGGEGRVTLFGISGFFMFCHPAPLSLSTRRSQILISRRIENTGYLPLLSRFTNNLLTVTLVLTNKVIKYTIFHNIIYFGKKKMRNRNKKTLNNFILEVQIYIYWLAFTTYNKLSL